MGDTRWTGAYGMEADIVARTHCSVELTKTDDIKVGCAEQCLMIQSYFASAKQFRFHVQDHILMQFLVYSRWQEILEKFEYFPIKCLIQRASEMYKKGLEMNEQYTGKRTFKTKVLMPYT